MSMFKGKIKGNHNFLKWKWKEITISKRNMKGKDHYFKRKTKEMILFQKVH